MRVVCRTAVDSVAELARALLDALDSGPRCSPRPRNPVAGGVRTHATGRARRSEHGRDHPTSGSTGRPRAPCCRHRHCWPPPGPLTPGSAAPVIGCWPPRPSTSADSGPGAFPPGRDHAGGARHVTRFPARGVRGSRPRGVLLPGPHYTALVPTVGAVARRGRRGKPRVRRDRPRRRGYRMNCGAGPNARVSRWSPPTA